MKLVFLGTRGGIEPRSRRHRRHAALLVCYRGARVMVDCGADWRGRLAQVAPDAILLTHAHPDHAAGLADGVACPVYATETTWSILGDVPVAERRTVRPRQCTPFRGIGFEFFPVEHSTRAPAGGYRIDAGRPTIFYVPDVVAIGDRHAALSGVRLYIGDGATVERSMVRRTDDALVGHAPLRTQLGWCEKEGVDRALFTHCGSEIVRGDERRLGPKVRRLGEERGVTAGIAHDGLELVLR